MKRRDLERKLRIAGCYLKREGSSHACGSIRKPELRKLFHYIEVKEPLAKKILKNLNAE